MTLRELKKERNDLTKQVDYIYNILNSTILCLNNVQKQLYKEKLENYQKRIDEINKEILAKRKRWA